MLTKLKRALSPGTVIGTIALFVALGGGYATAFSGSGTLQKAAAEPSSSYTTVRTLNGFGNLQHRCVTGGSPSVNLQLVLPTSRALVVNSFSEEENDYVTDQVGGGDTESDEIIVPGVDTTRIHVYRALFTAPPLPDGKQGVDIVVSTHATASRCGATQVLALNSIE